MAKGCIYIMTNPCLANMVKIGYAADVEDMQARYAELWEAANKILLELAQIS